MPAESLVIWISVARLGMAESGRLLTVPGIIVLVVAMMVASAVVVVTARLFVGNLFAYVLFLGFGLEKESH